MGHCSVELAELSPQGSKFEGEFMLRYDRDEDKEREDEEED